MSGDNKIRVRFAPSPTGQVHVGNARTALYNWLFARQQGGTMALRIEDTDVERSEARYEQQLLDDLNWLGIDWDEGPDLSGPYAPYRQSDRLEIYREHAERLLRGGKAYLCFCREEDLQRERDQAMAEHRSPIYTGRCRHMDPEEALRRRASGEPAAIRLRIPEHPIRFHDMVRGLVEFPNEVISDPIILRSSGMPVYNYVVVIDDALMDITHVIRGDDHLSNTPKQVALYEALGWPVPEFAHLSTILGSDRARLSKRHGAVSIANFRESGVLPEALVNYLALLGWAPPGGTREIFSRDELIREFDLSRVTPSPAVFDMEKLYWLNRHYIKEAPPERIRKLALPYYGRELGGDVAEGQGNSSVPKPEWSPPDDVRAWLGRITDALSGSVDRLEQLPERARMILHYDAKHALESPENAEVLNAPKTGVVLERFGYHLGVDVVLQNVAVGSVAGDVPDTEVLTPERFKAMVNQVKAETGAKGKDLFHPIRIAITGTHSGPEFDKLIPLIEEGSRLKLPRHVPSVRERVAAFMGARAA